MSHLRDLSPCTYSDHYPPNFLAVGWLEHGHPFPTGDVDQSLAEKLARMVATAYDPIRHRGGHMCDLCDDERIPPKIECADGTVARLGATNLFVPGLDDDTVFVTPSLVVHYMLDHGYQPPSSFRQAARQSALTDEPRYYRELATRIPDAWRTREEMWGFREGLGAAIARTHGLYSIIDRERHFFDGQPIPEEQPAKIRALALRLRATDPDDAQALHCWASSVASLLGE
jgi:hypothetical protein